MSAKALEACIYMDDMCAFRGIECPQHHRQPQGIKCLKKKVISFIY